MNNINQPTNSVCDLDTVAVIIPCCNEEITIQDVLDDFSKHFPNASIVVYDNNSTDRTKEIATAHSNPRVEVRSVPQRGKGNVVRQALSDIDADVYVLVDGDSTYFADDAVRLVDILAEGFDMVVGDRLEANYDDVNQRPFHGFGNKMVCWLIQVLYRSRVYDVMSGLRVFNNKLAKTIQLKSKGFEVEAEMAIFVIKHAMRACSVPIKYRNRPQGSKSKVKTVSDGAKVIWFIVKQKFMQNWGKYY